MEMIPASRSVDFASLQRKSFNEGDAAGYCEAWYSNFPDLEVLDGSVAAVVHDDKPCLSGLWLCNELSEGNDTIYFWRTLKGICTSCEEVSW